MDLSKIPKHRFKCHEWMQKIVRWDKQKRPVFDCAVRRSDINNMIIKYSLEFAPITTYDQVLHMLEIFYHFYREDRPQEHHIRAVATIIKEIRATLEILERVDTE